MPKLTIDDLKKIREEAKAKMTLRSGQARAKITVHMSTCGIAAGARDILDALLKEAERRGLHDVIVTSSSCAGLCSREPMATVEVQHQAPVKYVDLTAEKARRILDEHVLGGKIVAECALAAGSETTS
jgi:NADP-reducing hydrogenase subunit HndB